MGFTKLKFYNSQPTGTNAMENALNTKAEHLNNLIDELEVTIPSDGVINASTINESTSGAGVTVDGVLLKDGGITTSGLVIRTGVQAISGPGAINITTNRTNITTTGADAFTLANGVTGQQKTIVMVVDGGDATITPTTLLGFTTITLDAVGDTVVLEYGTGGWAIIGGNAYTAA